MMMSTFCLDVFKFIKSTQPINKSRVQKSSFFVGLLSILHWSNSNQTVFHLRNQTTCGPQVQKKFKQSTCLVQPS